MKCAPKIWKQFSPLEKLIWQDMYQSFSIVGNFPPEWGEYEKENKKKREVVAHNLACEAVWTLQLYIKDFMKNHG